MLFRSALQKRLGITSLYVTHDQGEAMALSDRVVVMHSGKILQIGAPEDIYRRPNSRAVAQFFGSPNLLEARVTSAATADNGLMALEVEGEGWRGSARGAGNFTTGDKVTLMLRPEAMHIVGSGAPAMSWRGEVVSSIFRGANRSIAVKTAAGVLNLDTSAFDPPALGSNVTVAANQSAAWALAS